jgi:AraC family transcriptional regulator, regulatory protein of adaptative response / methylated-DNA-[protein]-cysteine methyltransferase
MREIIRFAWGISSLGDFMVAMSDRGLVTLEFSSRHSAMEEALQRPLPGGRRHRQPRGIERCT